MKCFHHSDADGLCAAYWVHKRYPSMVESDFVKMNYGSKVDWFNIISKNEPVIIVDFSFEPRDLKRMMIKTKKITWIDHHKSAIEKYKNFGEEIAGIRYDGIAGCMLTYIYYFVMIEGKVPFDPNMQNTAPWMTKYIADHDVWKFEFGDETKWFSLAFKMLGRMLPLDPTWDTLRGDNAFVRKMLEDGKVIEKYRDNLGIKACMGAGFEYDLDGVKTFCLNLGQSLGGSEWFGDLIDKYDMLCSFSYNGKDKIWNYSLYSSKIDTTPYSTKRGGGGHAGASGFNSKDFIFT